MKLQYLPALICAAISTQLEAAKVIPNNAAANLVLGQPDFVTSSSVITSSFTLRNAGSIAVDPLSGKIFVADRNFNRVLRYASASSLENGAGAEAVFGQSSFGSSSNAGGQQGMSTPRSVFLDRKGRLWVADRGNNRVLLFEAAAYRSSFPFADRVFGQPDFATVTSGTTQAKMNQPQGVFVDADDRLWVADDENNRILRFDSVSTLASGSNASAVLGQSLFTNSTPGTGAAEMSSPTQAVLSSTGTLFVADSSNNRILRFANATSLGNGSPASGLLGQLDFTTITSGTAADKLNFPTGVWITPDESLWVWDSSNGRSLRFENASTIPSGSPANGVVGKPDFVTLSGSLSSQNLGSGFFSQLTVDSSGNLWTSDPANNRVLRFPPDTKKPTLTVTSNVPKSTTKAKLTVKGTASDNSSVSKVQFQVNGGTATGATGTTTWQFKASLKPGQNTIKVFAVDSVGNKSVIKTLKVTRS